MTRSTKKLLFALAMLFGVFSIAASPTSNDQSNATVRVTGGTAQVQLRNRFLLNSFNVKDFGAVCDGTTNDRAAIQATVDYADSVGGGVVQLPRAVCKIATAITLPAASRAMIVIKGQGMSNLPDATTVTGTVLKQTGAAVDAISAISTGVVYASYAIEDLSILGPDTWSPRTTTSGHAIKITGTDVPLVSIRNVFIAGFTGSGKAGVYIDNAEDSILDNVFVTRSHYGFLFSGGAFNGNVLNNLTSSSNVYGMYVDGSSSVSMNGGVIQSNEKTGLRMVAAIGWSLNSVHFENNNSTSAVNENAIRILPTGGATKSIQFFHCNTCDFFGNGLDNVYIEGQSGYLSTGIRFTGGYANSVTPPFATLGTYVQGAVFDGIVPASSISGAAGLNGIRSVDVTVGNLDLGTGGLYSQGDGGFRNALSAKDLFVTADAGIANRGFVGELDVRGDAGVGRNMTIGGTLTAPNISATEIGGQLYVDGNLIAGNNALFSSVANSMFVSGKATNGASAVAVNLGNSIDLATSGAEVVDVWRDSFTTKIFAIDNTGGHQQLVAPTLRTCGAATINLLSTDATGGAAAKYTKLCICAFNGTTYAWRNITNPLATGIGNTTTCPDNL